MYDFLKIVERPQKSGVIKIEPAFKAIKSSDLMIRGKGFYAIWDEDKQLWSTDEDFARKCIDNYVEKYVEDRKQSGKEDMLKISYLWDVENGILDKWKKFTNEQMVDNYKNLNETVVFANSVPKKEDYSSRRLSYSMEPIATPAYDELMNVLYSPEEKQKIEWAIGAIIAGDTKYLQKFLVLYGAPGTGKGTVIKIMEKLFEGYCGTFDAKTLSTTFGLESLRSNPLIAIDPDGDLSGLETNSVLNSVISHETRVMSEKYRQSYGMKFVTFLVMATNKPVRITDAKSGLLRRLIDVQPTGEKIRPLSRYNSLMDKVDFELGGIAYHCLDVYKNHKHDYDEYIPTNMMGASNHIYNYILENYDEFKENDSVTLKVAYERYIVYCEQAHIKIINRTDFKEELKNYFNEFYQRQPNGLRAYNYYCGFCFDKFQNSQRPVVEPSSNSIDIPDWLVMKEQDSAFDDACNELTAQYATEDEKERPMFKWENVKTTLNDISTNKLHYVLMPENHIVIDFDIKDSSGKKSFILNAKAAANFPKTYAELSKSGEGIHLHYIYTGDVSMLSNLYDKDIEIKVFKGNSSLRRKLTKCNDISIAAISSGLPLKEVKATTVNTDVFENERHLLNKIKQHLAKKYGSTTVSINYIYNEFEKAYASGMVYDLTSYRGHLIAFAANSTHNKDACLKKVDEMKLSSERAPSSENDDLQNPCVFDIEVAQNIFILCYKFVGKGDVIRLRNPTAEEVAKVTMFDLVGYNNRRYDNHICYGRMLGENNMQCFERSKGIIGGEKGFFFRNGWGISKLDLYDLSTTKQSLKKWECQLGSPHKEMEIDWNKPIPEELFPVLEDYCANDVLATEQVYYALEPDIRARQILVKIVRALGMKASMNDTTNSLTEKIIRREKKNIEYVYTDLATGEQTTSVVSELYRL